MRPQRVRVLVVEDHPILAQGLALVLGSQHDLELAGSAGTKADALERAREQHPDVVLMDHHLPDGTGADAAAAIRDELPDTAVVMLTGDESEDALLAAVDAGASGFLHKSEGAPRIMDALRRAARGEMLIPTDVLARLLATRRARAAAQSARERAASSLTPREREVLQLLAQGLDSVAIAERLRVAISTVRTYVQNILEKLAVHSKLEAVIRATELGIIEPSRRFGAP